MEKTEEVLDNFKCKICFNEFKNKFYNVREMQFGTRDEFIYCECGNCGCLQLINPPKDLAKYYPDNYYSFNLPKRKIIKEKLNIYRDRYAFGISSSIGKVLFTKYGEPTYIGWMKTAGVNLSSRILDVGCGKGKLLYRMANTGFKNLLGIDPFINKEIKYKNGARILKKDLFDVKGKYDLIMMHHSLEHLEDQHKIFKKLSELLDKNSKLFVRIPVCSSYGWENYRENWFALEAPRHFYNHSYKSIEMLAANYDFEIYKIIHDSESIHLWGSEQYKKDIPLYDDRSYFINPEKSIFTKGEMDYYENQIRELNSEGKGGQAGFFMVRN